MSDALTSMQEVEWLEPLVGRERNRDLERYVRQKNGFVPPHTAYLATCPWILRADIELDVGLMHINDLTGLIYLVVSRDNSCRFCYGASRMFMRLAGQSDEQIQNLERDVEMARLDPKVGVALEYARRVSRSNPPPGEADRKRLLEAGYPESAIQELAFFASEVVFHNRFATLLALPPQSAERIARSGLMVRVLKLVLRKALRRLSDRPQPEALADEFKTGPWSNVICALDGLVQARILRGIVDEAWASPHLPARTKALIFAVIARGLGSASAEREARRLLAEDGLAAQAVDDILAHLTSPELSAAETRILPYVRDTIWLQPNIMQPRGRELRAQLTEPQFIETVGIAALANMLCRLAIALDAP